MSYTTPRLGRACAVLTFAALLLGGRAAMAAEYWLQTGTTTAGGVPMWGYALCGTGSTAPAACTGAVSVPGPALVVPPGESLTVHLTNMLPQPTSFVIAGQSRQPVAMAPVWFEPATPETVYTGSRPPGNITARVRSFDVEAAAGGGTATYTWATIRPGTYLYSSGTHPQVQVQMGLYGAMTKDAGTGKVAYSQGATNIVYRNQITLLYSEIDPALHAAVAGGTYGTSGPTSTLNYNPKFFLINGKPYPDASLNPAVPPTLAAGETAVPAGQNLLVRFLNAGLRTHVPTIGGQYWQMIAEDGNPLPYLDNPRQQYTAFLPAGKTLDVLLKPINASPTGIVRHAIFDSRYYDTNDGNPGGGLVVKLDVGPSAPSAPVFDSTPVTTASAGTAYSYAAHATDPDGQTVSYALLPTPPAGMTIDSATGLITWPAASVLQGSYPVKVRASDMTTPTPLFSDQAFSLVVNAAANRPPVANNDVYTAVAHGGNLGSQTLAGPGVLANDTDPDGGPLTAVCTLASNNTCAGSGSRIVLNSNGGFTMSSRTSMASVQFAYRARDASGASSADATVTINMIDNRAPVANADTATAPRCTFGVSNSTTCRTGNRFYTPVTFNLAGNDTDPDTQTLDAANQLPLAVARVRAPQSSGNGNTSSSKTDAGGTVTVSGGNVTYVPPYNYTGPDSFQYRVKDKLGKESGSTTTDTNNTGQGWATVTITVQ